MAKTQLDTDLLSITGSSAIGRAAPATGSKLDIYGSAPVLSLSSGTGAVGADIASIKMYSDSVSAGQTRWAGIKAIVPTGAAGIDATALSFWTNSGGAAIAERIRIDPNGNLLVGATSGSNHAIQRSGATSAARILGINNAVGANVAYFWNQPVAVGENAADACMYVRKDATTNRSLNAAGTINASGADYAEYMTKADTCGAIAKGQILGINTVGQLTDKWAESVAFLIKSTNPSYVGGDVWGSEEALGMARPVQPVPQLPEYAGSAHPGEAPAVPDLPIPGDTASAEELATYDEQLAQLQAVSSAYDAALATWEQDQHDYAAQVAAAQAEFDSVTVPAYEADLAKFNDLLEAARQRVDRVAFCGQVPVNVLGATAGQYVVPVQDGDGIGAQLVDDDAITFTQYRRAVGIIQNVLADGRANVRVKGI